MKGNLGSFCKFSLPDFTHTAQTAGVLGKEKKYARIKNEFTFTINGDIGLCWIGDLGSG